MEGGEKRNEKGGRERGRLREMAKGEKIERDGKCMKMRKEAIEAGMRVVEE